jgi:hypothetical protein
LVQALVMVTRNIAPHAGDGVLPLAIIFHRHFFVLHTAPQPFDADGVKGSGASIQAEAHPTGQQRPGKGHARELDSWIGVEDCWLRRDQRALQG